MTKYRTAFATFCAVGSKVYNNELNFHHLSELTQLRFASTLHSCRMATVLTETRGPIMPERNPNALSQFRKDEWQRSRVLGSNVVPITDITLAVNSLKSGGVIAVPTDTIYGICCLSQRSPSIARIYDIKGRNCDKPIAISVAEISDIYKWANVTVSETLLKSLLPGPVTVVFERSPLLNSDLNPGTTLVGIRVPANGFVRDICRLCDEPLALTSANVSNTQSSLCVEEFKDLWLKLDLVFDGGVIGSNKSGSTVVDLSVLNKYSIIRHGSAYEKTVMTLERFGLSSCEQSTT